MPDIWQLTPLAGRMRERRMNATLYVVAALLRGAMFVPRQAPSSREPARVTPGGRRLFVPNGSVWQ